MKIDVKNKKMLGFGRFLKLEELFYTDRRGKARSWESVNRTGSNRAVAIIARILPEHSLVLIRQFRPPTECMMLEFPAGLIDAGENPAEAALRELKEETGYTGKVTAVTPFGFSSAGLTGEAISCVVVEVDQSVPPEPHPEENEDIEVVIVPEAQLEQFIAAHIAAGGGVDAKLIAYALGARIVAQ